MNRTLSLVIAGVVLPVVLPVAVLAADEVKKEPPEVVEPTIRTGYGDKGFELGTSDGNFLLQFQTRFQFRISSPWDRDPVTEEDLRGPDETTFKINRARIKIGGNAYRPWLKYYMEYELAAGNLLDYRFMVTRGQKLRLKVGQWKVQYSRERVISSGKQQMVDRSLINRYFTVDRQQGVSLYGRLKGSGVADLNYWASVFTGTGRGSGRNDDAHPMWMGRAQWNFLGRDVGFSGSDLKRRREAAGLVALAAVTNRSPYTRFSQAGGGELPGFDAGEPGQYRVNQWLGETAFKYRGLAWQQEFHWKRIKDGKNLTSTTLVGNYVQLGYFFHSLWSVIPKPLETAVRYSVYDPDIDRAGDLQRELDVTLNWFIKGHLNKISMDIAWFDFQATALDEDRGLRFRLQWDVSV